MKTLNYTTREINLDFRIKVYGYENGTRINKLVGVSGILELIGIELLNKFLDRAYRCITSKTVCHLRRGLVVTFYSK